MDDDTIADLKQFIAATLAQELSGIKTDMVEVKADLSKLNKKVDDGFAGVGDAIEELSNHVQGQLDNHETRITVLEHPA